MGKTRGSRGKLNQNLIEELWKLRDMFDGEGFDEARGVVTRTYSRAGNPDLEVLERLEVLSEDIRKELKVVKERRWAIGEILKVVDKTLDELEKEWESA